MRSVPTYDELVTTITEALRTKGFYVAQLDSRADDEIDLHRSAGRRAGRNLGWKVRTLTHGPRDGSTLLDLHVIVAEDVPQLAATRQAQMRQAIEAISLTPPYSD